MGLSNSRLAYCIGLEFFEDVFQHNLAKICKSQEARPQITTPNRGYLGELPIELLREIVDRLDPVSKRFLSQSSRGWRDLLYDRVPALTPCERWKSLCVLERARMYQNRAMPDVLACAFCKKVHPREDFQSAIRRPHIAYIGMENWKHPETRFCYRHALKRIDHGFKRLSTHSPEFPKHASKEHWGIVFERICGHCGSSAFPLENDEYSPASWSCSKCKDICKTCGITQLFCIVGTGTKRSCTGPKRTWYSGRQIVTTCADPRQKHLMIRDCLEWYCLKAYELDWSMCKLIKGLELPWPDLDAWRRYS